MCCIRKKGALDYYGILDKVVSVTPSKESLADWRSDYVITAVMIYDSVPSFDELMEFAESFGKEFNDWVGAK